MQEATSSAWTVPLNPPQSLFGWCRDAWEKLTLRAGWVWASLPVALGEGSSSDPIFLPLSWLGGSGRVAGRSLPCLAMMCTGCWHCRWGCAGGLWGIRDAGWGCSGLGDHRNVGVCRRNSVGGCAWLGCPEPAGCPWGSLGGCPGCPSSPAQPLAVLPRCLWSLIRAGSRSAGL